MQMPVLDRDYWSVRNLAASPQFVAKTVGDCKSYFLDKTPGHRFDPCGPSGSVRFAHSELQLEHFAIDIVCLRYPGPFCIHKEDAGEIFTVQFPLQGICEVRAGGGTLSLNPGEALIVNPEQRLEKHWNESLVQLMLRIKRSAFEMVLREEMDARLASSLVFDTGILSGSIGATLPAMVDAIWRDYHGDGAFRNPKVINQIERTLAAMILAGAPHNLSERFNQVHTVAPYYVKRAEDFIHAHAREVIGIADLVAASGASSRSLYSGFKRWRGTSPMSYLRRVRLDLARQDLQRMAGDGGTITQVALDSGYSHVSRFSRDYKLRFGERPSDTVLRGQRGYVS